MCGTCNRRSKYCFYDPKKDRLQKLVDDYQRARERIEILEGSRVTSHQIPATPTPTSSLLHIGKSPITLQYYCRGWYV